MKQHNMQQQEQKQGFLNLISPKINLTSSLSGTREDFVSLIKTHHTYHTSTPKLQSQSQSQSQSQPQPQPQPTTHNHNPQPTTHNPHNHNNNTSQP
jgi:hypothetical protein